MLHNVSSNQAACPSEASYFDAIQMKNDSLSAIDYN